MIDGPPDRRVIGLDYMEAPLFRLVQPMRLALRALAGFHVDHDNIAATTAYMSSTEQLDLRQVPLIVVAPDKLKAVLHHRALTLFAEAGLPIPGSDLSQRPPSAVLTLTLDSRPIDDLCPVGSTRLLWCSPNR